MLHNDTSKRKTLLKDIKAKLDKEVLSRNSSTELSYDKPDPLLVATRYKDETIALICALFAYGNARLIVKFLDSLDFGLLDESDDEIARALGGHYYRFQKSDDVVALFIALKRLKDIDSIENIFYQGYKKEANILDGLWNFISILENINSHKSRGYSFLIGSIPKKLSSAGTYKRYLMYLRWMVRSDSIDLGLWSSIPTSALLMPLDTHTFQVSRRLGLLQRKTYDMKASIELTQTLRGFDEIDPIKYDFALYRLGQEGLL